MNHCAAVEDSYQTSRTAIRQEVVTRLAAGEPVSDALAELALLTSAPTVTLPLEPQVGTTV